MEDLRKNLFEFIHKDIVPLTEITTTYIKKIISKSVDKSPEFIKKGNKILNDLRFLRMKKVSKAIARGKPLPSF